jgi:hypothetical protein
MVIVVIVTIKIIKIIKIINQSPIQECQEVYLKHYNWNK